MKKPTILTLAASLFLFSGLSADELSYEEENPFLSIEETILSLDEDFFFSDSDTFSAPAEIIVDTEEAAPVEFEAEKVAIQEESTEIVEEAAAIEVAVEVEELLVDQENNEELAVAEEFEPFTEDRLVDEVSAESAEVAAAMMQPSVTEASRESVLIPEFKISYEQVFKGAPVIYSLLFLMSMATVFIWFYNLSKLKHAGRVPEELLKEIRQKLHSSQYDEAIALCTAQNNFFCKMLAAGIAARDHGIPVMIDTMKAEGRRVTVTFWQRLGFLNDIALIAPMIGLLGTVLGMFFAFYDLNRSMESFSILFDGLGISVGTTVAGLIVAILALMLHSLAKFRLVRHLVRIENDVQSFATLIDSKTAQQPPSMEGSV